MHGRVTCWTPRTIRRITSKATFWRLRTGGGWDLGIFHPPCTHLAVSGARHFEAKRADGRQQEAVEFFLAIARLKIPRMAIENPVCIMSSIWRKPDQVVQPFQFGDPYMKTTCLWLKGLPHLVPTNIVEGREQKCWKEPPGPDRWKNRSRTYQGIANGMAAQWSICSDMVAQMEGAT